MFFRMKSLPYNSRLLPALTPDSFVLRMHSMALPDTDKQKRSVLFMLVLLTAVFGIFFAWQNALRGFFWATALESFFVVYSLVMIRVIRRTPNLYRWALPYVVAWVCVMLAILAMPKASLTVFIWPLLLPLVLHFLFGRRTGLVISVFGMSAATLIAWYRFGLPETPEEMVFVANVLLAAVVVFALSHVYERSRELTEQALQSLAATDTLTGLSNRVPLKSTFDAFSARATRDATPLALLLIDLDYFKNINDSHGHSAGDEVLSTTAKLMHERLRGGDFLCRLGGEEFLALLPESSPERTELVAEAIRERIQNAAIRFRGQEIPLTLSIGTAALGTDGDDLDTLLRAADKRLYLAKAQGRNKVIS